MKNILGLVTALIAFSLASCVEPYGGNGTTYQNNNFQANNPPPTQQRESRPQARKANIQWNLNPVTSAPTGAAYRMEVFVNGRKRDIGSGGEYYGNRPLTPNADGLPDDVISAYFVDGPDSVKSIFYAQQDGNTVSIYRVMRYSRGAEPTPRLVSTIRI